MKKYLIAFDLDGTLLDSQKEIQTKTKEYLKELQQRGHVLTIATGRPPKFSLQFYKQLDMRGPYVSYNGLYIYSPFDTSFKTISHMLKKDDVIKAMSLLSKYVEHYFAQGEDISYFDSLDSPLKDMFTPESSLIKYGKDLSSIIESDLNCLYFKIKDIKDKNEIECLDLESDLYIRFWGDLSSMGGFYYKGIDKASGLREVASYFGISLEDTIAFGDGSNDLEMLKKVGHPFAMKNSSPFLLEHIKSVTDRSNDEDGIYYALKSILG